MLKKTINYTDFDGNARSEDFYFNLTKIEVTEMELSAEGGLSNTLKKIVESEDNKRIIEVVKDLILKAYGEKTQDGKRFIKTQENREAFSQTEAFSELFMELVTNAELAAKFVNGILPTMQEPIKNNLSSY